METKLILNLYDLFLPILGIFPVIMIILVIFLLKKSFIPNTKGEIPQEIINISSKFPDRTSQYSEYIEEKLLDNHFVLDSVYENGLNALIKVYFRKNGNDIEGIYVVESNDVDYSLLDELGTYVYKVQKKYKNISAFNHNIYNLVIILGNLNNEFYSDVVNGHADDMYFGLAIINDHKVHTIKTKYSRINDFIDKIISLINE